jgi:hypothetical protein
LVDDSADVVTIAKENTFPVEPAPNIKKLSENGFVDGKLPLPERVEFDVAFRVTKPVSVDGAVRPVRLDPKN